MKKYVLFLLIIFYVNIVFSQVDENLDVNSLIEHLTNPKLNTLEEVNNYAVDQYINMLYLVLADTMNIAEDIIVVSSFFQYFADNSDNKSEIIIDEEKLCIKITTT